MASVLIPGRGSWNYTLHHHVDNGLGAHPASHPKNIGGFFHWGMVVTINLIFHLHPELWSRIMSFAFILFVHLNSLTCMYTDIHLYNYFSRLFSSSNR